jgi:hypothetical protein
MYYVSFEEISTSQVSTRYIYKENIKKTGDILSAEIEAPLIAGETYIFSVDLTVAASKFALSSLGSAENIYTFRPDSASEIQYTELKEGDQGDEVIRMQRALINLGFLSGSADGVFGKQTAQAVYDFKEANGIAVLVKPYVATNAMLARLYGGKATAFPDPAFALRIDSGEWNFLSGDMLAMRVSVKNIAKRKTVEAFELYLYATDAWGYLVYGNDMVYYATTTTEVAPGMTAYSDYMTVPNASSISNVYVGIYEIVYEDGTVETASNVDYLYWTIK